VRIDLVGDDVLAMRGMESMLRQEGETDVHLLSFPGALAYVSAQADIRADVVVILARAVDRSLILLVRKLVAAGQTRRVPVLVLTEQPGSHCNELLEIGSCVATRQRLGITEVLPLIRLVALGYVLVDRIHARRLAAKATSPDLRRFELLAIDRLTPRELDVFELMAAAKSNSEIAELLSVARSTVKSHVERIFAKLEIHDRLQVALFAGQHAAAPEPGPEARPEPGSAPAPTPERPALKLAPSTAQAS
jgi:DNA-binding NarL/FixJ family response regulator